MTLGEFMAKAEVMLDKGTTTRTAELRAVWLSVAIKDLEIGEYYSNRNVIYLVVK